MYGPTFLLSACNKTDSTGSVQSVFHYGMSFEYTVISLFFKLGFYTIKKKQ